MSQWSLQLAVDGAILHPIVLSLSIVDCFELFHLAWKEIIFCGFSLETRVDVATNTASN